MKYIEDNVEYIEQEPGIDGMYKMMELAARQCYMTTDLIKEGSARKIIDNVCIKHGHTSVTEFGTVYLKIPNYKLLTVLKYAFDRYSRVKFTFKYSYVTTTYRTIIQGDYKNPIEAIKNNFDKDWKDDLKYWSEPTKYHRKRYCFRFTMDRVGSQSVERHRGKYGISYAQESTRYVNYGKDKYENNIMVSLPSKFYSLIDEWSKCVDSLTGESFEWITEASLDEKLNFLRVHDRGWNTYEHSLKIAEKDYMDLVNVEEWKPEDARGVLNLDIKTQFMMCAYKEDWDMFLFRRVDLHAHPHIQSIANRLRGMLYDVI